MNLFKLFLAGFIVYNMVFNFDTVQRLSIEYVNYLIVMFKSLYYSFTH